MTGQVWLYKVQAMTKEHAIPEFYVKAPGMGEAIAVALDYITQTGALNGDQISTADLVVFQLMRTVAPPPIVNG